jgi:actin related protein 2/3 complex subunit 1A/1B
VRVFLVFFSPVAGAAPSRTFTKAHELNEHDQLVSALDWAPTSNRLVSCSHDRNSYVWTHTEDGATPPAGCAGTGTWKPTLVLLRINRAAVAVKWSPKENKFAVTSGAKCVSVCYFEAENDWWVSKVIKKHKSTVTSVHWHPNNCVLATGSTDFKARVFSAFVKEIDDKASAPVTKCGELLAEIQARGWVHEVRFSPSGARLAFVAHDSSIGILDWSVEAGAGEPTVLLSETLPFTRLAWVSEDALVATGHDMNPYLISSQGGQWAVRGAMDKGDSGAAQVKQGVSAAFAKFQAQASTGQDAKGEGLKTRHQMLISGLEHHSDNLLSSSGLDGRFAFWDLGKYLDGAKTGLK